MVRGGSATSAPTARICSLLARGSGDCWRSDTCSRARRFPSAEHTAHAVTALVRFSGMGYAAVAVLISSGLVNAWALVGTPAKLLTTSYGQLLLVKVCLLAGMLVLAAQNRFRLVPELQKSKASCLSAESSFQVLRRNVIGEQILGLTIVLIVAWLGTLPPATTASQ